MPSVLNPYISFKNNAREAMEFYQSVFGGQLTISTFKEAQASQSPSDDNLIMHAQLNVPNGFTLMASDTPSYLEYQAGTNISISLSGSDEGELSGYYQKLAAGGAVTQSLEKAPWGDTFGMLTDKFGVNWMVNIAGQPA
jgi:PhnB protein